MLSTGFNTVDLIISLGSCNLFSEIVLITDLIISLQKLQSFLTDQARGSMRSPASFIDCCPWKVQWFYLSFITLKGSWFPRGSVTASANAWYIYQLKNSYSSLYLIIYLIHRVIPIGYIDNEVTESNFRDGMLQSFGIVSCWSLRQLQELTWRYSMKKLSSNEAVRRHLWGIGCRDFVRWMHLRIKKNRTLELRKI